MMGRVGVRFAAEAAAILAAAIIAGPVLHLVWWQVGLVVFAVLGLAILVESSVGTTTTAPRPAAPAAPEPPPVEERPHVRVLQERPLSALVPDAVPEPEPAPEVAPEPEPEPAPVAVAAPPVRVSGPPYNVWELERALNASGSANDEQTFLLQYLRDYAGADGALPPEFDDLVRESFPALA